MSECRVLIVGPAWVGDMVMAQALFKLLKARHPDGVIDVLAPAWSRLLVERMPEVNRAIAMPLGHGELQLITRWRLGKALRQYPYDQAIVLPNSWKSAYAPFAARIPQRTGWLGELRWGLLNDVRRLDPTKWPLMVERFLALGEPDDAPCVDASRYWPRLQVTPETVAAALARFELSHPADPVVALCPGAEFGPAKRWPESHYAEVAVHALRQGAQVWLFGSSKDQPVARAIQQATQQRCVDLTGRTTLGEAIDLLSLASVVITNDSGLMHIAAALQRPLVVVYGSSSPRYTPPLAPAVQVKILSLQLDCSPCFQRTCPLGHLKCLHDLPANQVITAWQQLIGAC